MSLTVRQLRNWLEEHDPDAPVVGVEYVVVRQGRRNQYGDWVFTEHPNNGPVVVIGA